MTAEIITIGDELLYGSRTDTNSVFLARHLDAIGIDIKYITTTGDDMELLVDAINLAMRRVDIVVATGGLGPTDDDITKKAICKVFKRNLIFHEDVLADLQRRFAERGVKMPAINQNQALLPQGAQFLKNRIGSALGIIIDEQGKFFCSLPGVPIEMRTITEEELIPLLAAKSGGSVIIRHVLRTTGIMESTLAETIRPYLKFSEGISLAYLPSFRGVDLCIKGNGSIREEVEAGVKLLADGILRAASDYIYAEGDRELEAVVGDLLVSKGLTLATAESCTGGLLGGRLTTTPGSSRYYLGGIVAYANEVKMNHLGVVGEIIERHGAVSPETAKAMAAGIITAMGADIGVSITGIAGPDGGTEDKPVGTVFVGVATANREVAGKFMLGNNRQMIRERAVTAALDTLRRELPNLK
jgi:nicotinamide-nucleotide amidase